MANRSTLQHAMRVIDGQDAEVRTSIADEGIRMLEAAHAAHEAEAAADAGQGALEADPDAEARAAEQAKRDAAREDARRKLMKAEAFADAIITIARAKARAGHDLTTWSPSEAQHVLNAYEMFSEAQNTPAPDLPHSFKGESDPAALARGAAVADVLSQSDRP